MKVHIGIGQEVRNTIVLREDSLRKATRRPFLASTHTLVLNAEGATKHVNYTTTHTYETDYATRGFPGHLVVSGRVEQG